MNPARVGVLGAGRWGSLMADAFRHVGANVCVFDIDERRGWPWGTRAVSGHRLDAVVITTPTELHAGHVEDALDQGAHVLVTKPMTLSHAAAVHLFDAAKARGRVLMCDHTYIFDPAHEAARLAIEAGRIGAPRHIETARLNTQRGPGPSPLWDLGPHDLSIWDWWFGKLGPLRDVDAKQFGWRASLTARVGRLDAVECGAGLSWASADKVRRTVVGGDSGLLMIEGDRLLLTTNKQEPLPVDLSRSALELEAEHFLRCIRGEAEPRGDALAVMAALDAAANGKADAA